MFSSKTIFLKQIVPMKLIIGILLPATAAASVEAAASSAAASVEAAASSAAASVEAAASSVAASVEAAASSAATSVEAAASAQDLWFLQVQAFQVCITFECTNNWGRGVVAELRWDVSCFDKEKGNLPSLDSFYVQQRRKWGGGGGGGGGDVVIQSNRHCIFSCCNMRYDILGLHVPLAACIKTFLKDQLKNWATTLINPKWFLLFVLNFESSINN